MWDNRPLILYRRLFDYFGPQNWWPAETELEMMVGAVLTQAVNWKNASVAITNLKREGMLTLSSLYRIGVTDLALFIKPSGYYNLKARRIKGLISFIQTEWQGDLKRLKEGHWEEIRDRLLSIWGLGPETVDSILLYAGGHPVFVVDSYTTRIVERLGLLPQGSSYQKLQTYFMENLPPDVALLGEYHALLVALGKDFCKKKPRCSLCFLQDLERNWQESGP